MQEFDFNSSRGKDFFKKNPPICHLAKKVFQMNRLHGTGDIPIIKIFQSEVGEFRWYFIELLRLAKLNEQSAARQMSLARE